jgi:hypothetical protein
LRDSDGEGARDNPAQEGGWRGHCERKMVRWEGRRA